MTLRFYRIPHSGTRTSPLCAHATPLRSESLNRYPMTYRTCIHTGFAPMATACSSQLGSIVQRAQLPSELDIYTVHLSLPPTSPLSSLAPLQCPTRSRGERLYILAAAGRRDITRSAVIEVDVLHRPKPPPVFGAFFVFFAFIRRMARFSGGRAPSCSSIIICLMVFGSSPRAKAAAALRSAANSVIKRPTSSTVLQLGSKRRC